MLKWIKLLEDKNTKSRDKTWFVWHIWFGELEETKPQRDTNASDESKVDLKYFTYRTTTVGGLENIFCELVWDILPKKCLQTILTTTIFRDLLWGKWWEMDRLTQKQICVFRPFCGWETRRVFQRYLAEQKIVISSNLTLICRQNNHAWPGICDEFCFGNGTLFAMSISRDDVPYDYHVECFISSLTN